MILELHISNFATIEETSLIFNKKSTALIGETGAGKSLIVNSLLLLTGARSDFSLLRDPEKKASVSALFQVEKAFLERHEELKDYVSDDQTILLKRVLNKDKTSRFYLNGEVVNLNTIKLVTGHLLDIHSQNAKSDLLDENKQYLYVDYSSKKIPALKEDYQNAYQDYLRKKEEYEEFLSSNKEMDVDYLSFQIAEIEKYHLQENEIEDLNARFESLKGLDRIREKYETLLENMNASGNSFLDTLGLLSRSLRSLSDSPLKEKAEKCSEDLISFQEDFKELESQYEDLSIDPMEIDKINERLFSLKGLMRKYGSSTKEILQKYQDYKKKLNDCLSFDEKKMDFEDEVLKKKEIAKKKAEILSSERKEAALILEKKIQEEMASLGLRKGGFFIRTSPKEELSIDGNDKVIFYVKLNEGLEENPLSKAASGGEASRLMLALKIVLNSLDPYDLLVLDEIDTGIDGKAAYLVGKRIQSLAKDSSLLVISHLPQVVSSCQGAILIEKKTIKDSTFTMTTPLDEKGMIEQIAKMLSLEKVSKTMVQSAEELYHEFHHEK